VIGLITTTELDRTSMALWKSNTTNDYGDMTHSSLHQKVKQVYYLSYPCKKLSADDAGYHDTPTLDDGIDEILQEEELLASFVVKPGAGLNNLVTDADDIRMLVK
jgi:hypothetical protein